jgi:DHA2 family multidrug resistance protein-like MFS transporter
LMLSIMIVCLGLAPIATLATDLVVSSAPLERAGAASAMSETSAELGGATGIAVLGSIATAIYRSHMEAGIPSGVPPETADAALDTLGGAVAVASKLPAETGVPLLDAAKHAFVAGVELSAVIGGILAIMTAAITLAILRKAKGGVTLEAAKEVCPAE